MRMRRNSRVLLIAFTATLGLILAGISISLHATSPSSRDYSALVQAVAQANQSGADPNTTIATDGSHRATVGQSEVDWFTKSGAEYVSQVPTSGEAVRMFDEAHFYNWSYDLSTPILPLLLSLVPTLLFVGLLVYLVKMMRGGGGLSGLGRAKAKLVAEHPGITFKDVAGCPEAVTELQEVVEVLRNPQHFTDIGARTPRGVLLVGPPGTGKTLLARAVAGEAGVAFFNASGSEFVEMFVGVGAARVRDLFTQARAESKAIIFIDEIDAVGRHRGGGSGHANDEREQTLNQLLVEMDGFDNTSPIIVIAATNRPDILDNALLRPGRFDRQVTIDLPDIKGRREILDIHSRNRPIAKDVNLDVIARHTPGFSGADLANLINEGALLSARAGKKLISTEELESATMRVLAGPERANRLLSDEERRVVAYHELGHALVGHILPHANPVHKITIVSRGRALGMTVQLPERDQVLRKRSELTDQLAGLLGGRIAEELVFGAGDVTTGAADDIEKATKIATQMVTAMGMSPLGARTFFESEIGQPRAYSEELASQIDAEIDHLLTEAQLRARHVLSERRALLDKLADHLLEVETMDAAELAAIVDGFPRAAQPLDSIVPLRPAHRRRQEPTGTWLLPEPLHEALPVSASMSMRQERPLWMRRAISMVVRLTGAEKVRS